MLLGAFCVFLILTFGSIGAGLAIMRGDLITVEPAVLDIGQAQRGTTRTVSVDLRNLSNQPLTVIGGTSTCKCVVTRELPLTILPGQVSRLPIDLRFSGAVGDFRQQFVLYVDSVQRPKTVGRLTGRIVDADPAGTK